MSFATALDTAKLLNDFHRFYEMITDEEATEFKEETFFHKTKIFMVEFFALGRKKREGY